MSKSNTHWKAHFKSLTDEELTKLIIGKNLTEQAHTAAQLELKSRGLETPKNTTSPQVREKNSALRLIQMAFNGVSPLADTFLGGIAIFLILIVPLALSIDFFPSNLAKSVFYTPYVIFCCAWGYCLYKCSRNSNSRLASWLAERVGGLLMISGFFNFVLIITGIIRF